ncbi:RNA pseudouridine synthase [Alcaligenes faecalis]|jgi:23S rRNA pseudouridine1911/1915/1917 synthase|uniref:RluA family pseudouridine synthase n=1 Tax=Alcaligenes TaxID=507 RepID=UPI000E976420|nr:MULTISPECIES: RluA family pseudouridine synthase [Alcaligenes]QRF91458.1 RNA pseudouridine synthase [Alcaligenes faecalis]HBJ66761.1 RluA family pseudouridine synthase [Alcaligenes faecalis]
MPDTDTEKDSVVSSDALRFILPITASPDRLDKTLARLLPQHSRSRLQSWVESGHVLVNGQAVKVKHTVYPGDTVLVWEQQAPEDMAFEPDDVDFEIVAQSDSWLVVNKPVGLVTHPGAGNWRGTLLNGLLFRFPHLRQVPRAGVVHRLDKDTSGLLVVARTEVAQTHFVRQLQERSMGRQYLALVHGVLPGQGSVDEPIGRDLRVPVRMSTGPSVASKHAVTHYQMLRQGYAGEEAVTEVACRLETGRTHQIRVHLSSIKHPLLADTLYGGRVVAGAQRQMLHAHVLEFDDPDTGERRRFSAEPPSDYQSVAEAIEWHTQS